MAISETLTSYANYNYILWPLWVSAG